jgi:hypothetical protein
MKTERRFICSEAVTGLNVFEVTYYIDTQRGFTDCLEEILRESGEYPYMTMSTPYIVKVIVRSTKKGTSRHESDSESTSETKYR